MNVFSNYSGFAIADPFAEQWEAVLDAINNLDRYGPNWDGEGAQAVRLNLIRTASDWLKQMRGAWVPPDSVYPTVGGTIMLEWHPSKARPTTAHVRVPGVVEVVDFDGQGPRFESIQVASSSQDAYEFTIAKRGDPSDFLQDGKFQLAA